MASVCRLCGHPLSPLPSGQAPQLVSQPSNTTAYENTTLPCTASGSPGPTISWYRDGVLLDLAEDPRLTLSSVGLVVSGLQETGGETLEGVYQCTATSDVGAVRSLPATLTRASKIQMHSRPVRTSSPYVCLRGSSLLDEEKLWFGCCVSKPQVIVHNTHCMHQCFGGAVWGCMQYQLQ